ncbi:MAG: hypothetical protein KC944_06715 [Candidatus Omnitrophica bacterium]|nr:hypothetical protein [Candidatus Omnitrophota bacterium]
MAPERPLIRTWIPFLSGVFLLAGLLVLLSDLSPDKVTTPEVVRNNYEEGIEATALFYTEVEIPMGSTMPERNSAHPK